MCVCAEYHNCSIPDQLWVRVRELNLRFVQEISLEVKQQGTVVLKCLFGSRCKGLVIDDVLGNRRRVENPEGCYTVSQAEPLRNSFCL